METKILEKADFETGMTLVAELAALQEKLIQVNNAYQVFVAILRRRYDAPEGEYELRDWAEGFVPATVSQNDDIPNN